MSFFVVEAQDTLLQLTNSFKQSLSSVSRRRYLLHGWLASSCHQHCSSSHFIIGWCSCFLNVLVEVMLPRPSHEFLCQLDECKEVCCQKSSFCKDVHSLPLSSGQFVFRFLSFFFLPSGLLVHVFAYTAGGYMCMDTSPLHGASYACSTHPSEVGGGSWTTAPDATLGLRCISN